MNPGLHLIARTHIFGIMTKADHAELIRHPLQHYQAESFLFDSDYLDNAGTAGKRFDNRRIRRTAQGDQPCQQGQKGKKTPGHRKHR